jgi:GntR family transcriptional regulator
VCRRKGAFVAIQQKAAYSLSSPLIVLDTDLAAQGIAVTVKTLVFESVTAPLPVQEILNSAIAYLPKKVLLFNDIPGCVDVTCILPQFGKVYAKDLRQQMAFSTLEKHGINIEKIDAAIEFNQANYETSAQLEVLLGHPPIVYRHTVYTDENCAIVHGESISRGDRFCYSVQIRREN